MADNRPIGVMDSGMGGISVLRALMAHMPNEKYIFWGDNKNAPYGFRDVEMIRQLTNAVVDRLLNRDIKALVIACNTATSAAASDLRKRLSIPVLGLEPALKPASEFAGDGLVVVLATEATLKLEKYQRLLERYGRNTVSLPCPELVEFVENGDLSSDNVMQYISSRLSPYRKAGIRAIVLGCTHFVWLADAVHEAIPEARIFDGNDGLARHMRELLAERALLSDGADGSYELHTTSDDPQMLKRMTLYLNMQ